MKSLLLLSALIALPFSAFADQAKDKKETEVLTTSKDSVPITVSAKGTDVCAVLASIFEQEKKQYVFEGSFHTTVYLSLENADFHRALDIVCSLSGLQTDLKDGIYFVHVARNAIVKTVTPTVFPTTVSLSTTPTLTPAKIPTTVVTKPIVTKLVVAKPEVTKSVAVLIPVETLGPVPSVELQRHVTTRTSKSDIRALFAEMSKQTGVKIVVDAKVPAYKLDAFLINTSLRYALNKVTHAAGLAWKLPQNRTVVITSGEDN
jgi:type II secretory pathway component GspD/PulD (secretin)